MAKLGISTGTTPNDGTGDSLLSGAVKINSNFTEIYTRFGDGTNLTSIGGTWVTTSVGIHTLKSVGIGTTNPTSKLNVLGDVSVSGVVTASTFSGQVNSGVGTVTTLSGTTASYTTANITTGNIVTGVVTTLSGTNITYSGVGTVTKFHSTSAVLTNINSSGISTLGVTTTTRLTAQQLNVSGIATLGNTVVGGATTQLMVVGDARITGILTIGTGSITLDGSSNRIKIGSGVTISESGTASFTQGLSVSGVVTATSFVGDGSLLTGIVATGSGVDVKDDGSLVGTAPTLDFGDNLSVTFGSGIATVTGAAGGGVGAGGTWVTTVVGIHTLKNVGIGTTNPTSALTVLGDVNITGVVTVTGQFNADNTVLNNIAGTNVNIAGLSTFAGNVNITGGADVYLADNGIVNLGSSNDLQLLHDGTKSIIKENGTGGLQIQSDNEIKLGKVEVGPESEKMAIFTPDGSVELYYDNTKTFETIGTGITVTGDIFGTQLSVSGVGTFTSLNIGGSPITLNSLLNPVLSSLSVSGTSTLGVTTITNLTSQQLKVSGISTLGVTSTTDLTSQQLNVSGVSTFNQDIRIAQGYNAYFGGGNELGIIYNGSYSTIQNTTKDLYISGTGADRAIFKHNGAVELYHSGSKKFETIGAGASITGTTFTNQLSVSGGGYVSGNLGIGSTNPSSNLSIEGNASVSGIVTATQFRGDGSLLTGVTAVGTGVQVRDNASIVGTAGTIDFGDGLIVSPLSAGIVTVTSGSASQWTTTNAGIHTLGSVGIATTNPKALFHVGAATTQSFVVHSDGRVAIGTTGFAQSVDLDGMLLVKRDTGLARIRIRNDSGANGTYSSLNLKTPNSDWSVYVAGDTNEFRIFDVGQGAARVHIDSAGNFGINNTNPTRTLDVTGNAAISSNLIISGISTFAGIATVTGSTLFTKQLSVSGIATIGPVASGTTSLYLGGPLKVGEIDISGASNSVHVGQGAGRKNYNGFSGQQNTAVGCNALAVNQSSNFNAAFGTQALANLGDDAFNNYDSNTAVGASAGGSLLTGFQNTFVGRSAGYYITSGANNTILGIYDGNSGGLDIRTSSNNVVIADGQGNIRLYTNSSGNTGIGTTNPTSKLTVSGGVNVTGIVTASSFSGSNTLKSRVVVSGVTTSIGIGSTANVNIDGYKTYSLLKVGITSAAWVVLYTDATSRTNDAGRSYLTDPTPGSGVIAEVRTTNVGVSTFIMSPGIIGWNNDVSVGSTIYARVTNNDTSAGSITVNLTVVKLED